MSDNNPFNLELYKNPKVVGALIDAMQEQSPISQEERNILLTNPALSERVFNGGLKEAIVNGKTSITELSKLPGEVVTSLTYNFTANALMDGTLKISQVSALDKEKGKEFADLVASHKLYGEKPGGGDYFDRIAEILSLNKEQSAALLKL